MGRLFMACYFKQRLNSKTAKLLRRRKREVGLKCCKPDLNLYQQNEQNNSTYLHRVLTRCEVIRFQLSTPDILHLQVLTQPQIADNQPLFFCIAVIFDFFVVV